MPLGEPGLRGPGSPSTRWQPRGALLSGGQPGDIGPVEAEQRMDSVMLPLRDGITIARKR